MGNTADYVNGEPRPVASDNPSIHDLVVEQLQWRKAFGLKKYGTYLQAFNGRNSVRDALDEVLDLAVYLKQTEIELESIGDFLDWVCDVGAVMQEMSCTSQTAMLEEVIERAVHLRGRIRVSDR